ncbi:MAG: dihydroneopterin aldolase [Lentisphaeria bacterium]|nr:dihydroneopterin aldolase [Lentisphaeria bacterium]
MARITVESIQIETIVGTYRFERHAKQIVELTFSFESDITKAAKNDDLKHADDYAKITNKIKHFTRKTKFLLIETLATEIYRILTHEFELKNVELTLRKPAAIKAAKYVEISLP